LDEFCKSYELNRKTEMEKKRKRRKENKNIKLGLREPFRPRSEKEPAAHLLSFPNRYPAPLLSSLTSRPQ
jgi:hypothetical protein